MYFARRVVLSATEVGGGAMSVARPVERPTTGPGAAPDLRWERAFWSAGLRRVAGWTRWTRRYGGTWSRGGGLPGSRGMGATPAGAHCDVRDSKLRRQSDAPRLDRIEQTAVGSIGVGR